MISGGSVQEFTPFGRSILQHHPKHHYSSTFSQKDSNFCCVETEPSRDLFRALNAVSLQDHPSTERWITRKSSSGEEELYTCDNVVVYSVFNNEGSSRLIKTFTMQSNVLQAVWCSFFDDDNDSVLNCICAFDAKNLKIYSDTGDYAPSGLPFQVSRLFPTDYGLLLERLPLQNELNTCSTATHYPLLFILSHPQKDIAPVIFKPAANSNSLTYLTIESKLELVTICQSKNISIFYHKSEGIHSVWKLRKATEIEIASITDNLSRASCDPFSNSYYDSPFASTARHSSIQSTLLASNLAANLSSPFRTLNAGKPTSGSVSVSSPSMSQDRSIQSSGSSTYLSPLRSSRLAVSPASPLLRTFSSPSNPKAFNATTSCSKMDTFYSPLNRLSTPSRFLADVEILDDIESPIFPEMCFEHLWSESQQLASGRTSKAFITSDLMGQDYIAFLLSQQQQLKLVRFDSSNDGRRLIFGTLNMISAKDAVPLDSLSMICVLDPSGNLVLYSGTYKISLVYLPSLIYTSEGLMSSPNSKSFSFQSPTFRKGSLSSSSRPTSSLSLEPNIQPRFSVDAELSPVLHDNSPIFENENLNSTSYKPISNIISLRDSCGDKITLENSQSHFYHVSIPQLSTSLVVEMCLKGLKSVLPKDIGMNLLIRWYCQRNCPGPSEFNATKELNLFKYFLYFMIGYDMEQVPFAFDSSLVNKSPSLIKKLKLESDEKGTDEDWEYLISSSSTKDSLGKFNSAYRKPINSSSPFFPYLPSILFSLHLIYEELQLNLLLKDLAFNLCDILYTLAGDLRLILYQDHYWRMMPSVGSLINQVSGINSKDSKLLIYPNFFTESPPNIYNHLQLLMTQETCPFPYIHEVTHQIRKLILIYGSICCDKQSESDYIFPINNIKHDIKLEFEMKTSQCAEERVVLAMNRLKYTQNDLKYIPAGLVLPLWGAIFKCKPDPSVTWNLECYSLIGRTDLATLTGSRLPKYPIEVKEILDLDNDEDGLSGLNRDALNLLFPDDQRVNDAYEMLQSSKPVNIVIQQRPGVSDHDFIEEQERHLYTLCIRTMALPVGRGMFTLRTYKPVVAKTFPIPKLCLSGKVPPRNTSVDLSHIDVPANMNTWPLFHNGVAAGLRVCQSASETIDSQWITYNKPKSTTVSQNDAQNEHAGLLFALGLNGHLARLSTMSIHDYLCKGNELTRVAILLGLAAAKRGSMDMSAVKILSIHVEALLPSSSTELDVPPVVEVAAVLGIGFLYQGSGHRHIAEVLLREIGRPPGPEMEHYIDRESYALSAGLALGLVTLGKGNEMISVLSSEGISMADELCNYMVGGHKRPLSSAQKERYKTPSYQIREGDYVNSDVTSPGATLALGLMFFNTNNQAVAEWVVAPDTQYLLESVRPDFLLLRTLSKGLIMWNSIKPTKEWIDSHLPPIVAENALIRDIDFNSKIDYETMSQAYCNIIAGACMALGLKYAGSANQEAFDSINAYVNLFINLPNEQSLAEQAGRSTIESCLNVLIISLTMIMAGTGNVEIMRICRYLRSRISQVNVVLYGSHMASHMALGLLFLGGCRYTLSSSPEAIAALICAFFPKYPIHSNDNRYHLQAFRHLYVLATEPRLVLPRDIDTGKLVYAHLTLKYRKRCAHQSKERLKAPCFLPELNLLEEIILDDERYWKISFNRDKNWSNLKTFLSKDGQLYVKQKVGCLSYQEDPEGYKSIHAQRLMKDAVKGWSYKPNTLTSFSSNPVVINYSKYLLASKSLTKSESAFQQNLAYILFNCASDETVDCLPSILHFLKIMNNSDNLTSFDLLQVRLLVTYEVFCKFIKVEFVEGLKTLIWNKLKVDKESFIKYLRGDKPLSEVDPKVSKALIFLQLPPYSSLAPLKEKISFMDVMRNIRHFNLPITSQLYLSLIFSE